MLLVDYHIHPNYSKDSKGGSISEFCEKAIEIGLSEVCFTTHYDVDPQRLEIDGFVVVEGQKVSVNSSWLDGYLEEIDKARKLYMPQGLKVFSGLEVDYGSDFEEVIKKHLSGYKFDYFLGAVHCINHLALAVKEEAKQYFERKDADKVCGEYYKEVKRAIESNLFDAIAHLDFYKREGIIYFGKIIRETHKGLVEPVLRLLAENGIALEINALGYKDNFGEPYPGEDILLTAKREGVKLVTVGSDCHSLEFLGAYIKDVMELVEKYGFELWRPSER